MQDIKGYTYYGKKSGRYLECLFQILPEEDLTHIVECCMGSGTFIANYGFEGAKRTAIELDKGVYQLNKCIRDEYSELLEYLEEMEYSEKEFDRALEIINDDKVQYEDLVTARAVYTSLVMSYNSMRTSYRKLDTLSDNAEKPRTSRQMIRRIQRNTINSIICLNKAWQGVEMINDSFFNHSNFWCEGKHTLCFADVPYQKCKRGMNDKTKNAGYRQDWNEDIQDEFLEFVIQMNECKDKASNIIICANIEVDENGNLVNLKNDKYNKVLLKKGFRLVVILTKASSEIRSSKTCTGRKKKRKAEVVYINYKNIIGNWNNYEYYDYEDIYGKGVQ